MHEVQHAIQNEQKLAAGGSRKLAYAALVSDAYEAVKDTPEFQSLQTKEERLHYLEEAAAKQAGAPDIETAATNGYVNLGGRKNGAANGQSAGITPKTSVKKHGRTWRATCWTKALNPSALLKRWKG